MDKAIRMLKKWLIKKDLIKEADEIKVAKIDTKSCNIYKNNRIMGTGILNTEKKRIEGFKFLRTKTSKKPLLIVRKPGYQDVKRLRRKNVFTLGDYVNSGIITIKNLNQK